MGFSVTIYRALKRCLTMSFLKISLSVITIYRALKLSAGTAGTYYKFECYYNLQGSQTQVLFFQRIHRLSVITIYRALKLEIVDGIKPDSLSVITIYRALKPQFFEIITELNWRAFSSRFLYHFMIKHLSLSIMYVFTGNWKSISLHSINRRYNFW